MTELSAAAAVHPEVALPATLDRYRQNLLDLGVRNPLIAFRYLKARSVSFIPMPGAAVVNALVAEGRRLAVEPRPENTLALTPQVEALDGGSGRDWAIETLRSDLPPKRLADNLKGMSRDARSALEEQGLNMLFLAVGMLHWYESPSSEEPRRAPLLLVPVTLERIANDRYGIRHTGDELEENPSLLAKLEAEFGIRLPPPGGDEARDPAEIARILAAGVEGRERWRVVPDELALGFFSFTRHAMFKDLTPHEWPAGEGPLEHPLLSGILGDGLSDPAPATPEDAFLDDLPRTQEVLTVKDCDGSQMAALLDVRAGRHLVIEGPPGTGKSQTITNLIADAIARGQTVLFVSEKRAALDVVKRRLDEVGIGNACLELHSQKANKRSVLAELQRTLNLDRTSPGDRAAHLERLTRARDTLNAHCRAMNEPWGSAAIAPYRALGELLLIKERTTASGRRLPPFDASVTDAWDRSRLAEAEATLTEIQGHLERLGPLSRHPFRMSARSRLLPSEHERLETMLREALQAVKALDVSGRELATTLGLAAPLTVEDHRKLHATARRAQEAPDCTGLDLAHPAWQDPAALATWLEEADRLEALHARFEAVLLPEAWDQPMLDTRTALAAHGRTWWRFFIGAYRRARAHVAGLSRTPPATVDEALARAEAIMEARRLRESLDRRRAEVSACLGARLEALQERAGLLAAVKGLGAVHAEVRNGEVPREIWSFLERHRQPGRPVDPAAHDGRLTAHRTALVAIGQFLEFDEQARWGGPLLDLPLADQLAGVEAMHARLDELQTTIVLGAARDRARGQGLGPLVDLLERWDEAQADLLDAFRYGFHQRVLDRAFEDRPVLQTFEASRHEAVRDEFRRLDRELHVLNQRLLTARHLQGMPSLQAPEGTIKLLKQEFEKRRQHMPIRRLLGRCGHLIQQAIKPVFMMSPLSVATFIPPGTLTFDLVIFDEASQVEPVDAFGALMRGRQVVVVGDSKQMPPTDFFSRTMAADDDPDEEPDHGAIETESILGLFRAKGAPHCMLRWHYRSQHESLITVSNHLFYENKLVVFPGPRADREHLGLVYRHLPDTVYDRSSSRTNREEARIVAQTAMRHATTKPDWSLGIAAFSVAQRDAILDEIELLARENPDWEAFQTRHPHEPFFVKNLENVQGDERDVILVSIGYGRDARGQVGMNFGPVNKDSGGPLSEGERRLNVLFTRSRRRCEVFTNMQPEDLDLNRSQARGVRALRAFLTYARSGSLDVPTPTGGDADSPFEEAVGRILAARGHRVVRQVGSAGFRIDLAITDPRQPGRYLLGIECDGATYHGSRSARDRDRLRQQVLESLGWRIHRVWSTDWFRNPGRQVERIEAAIARALAEVEPANQPAAPPPPLPAPGPAPDGPDGGPPSPPPGPPGSGCPPYVQAELRLDLGGREFHQLPAHEIATWIQQVVAVESPVHEDDVRARLAAAAGVRRLGSRIVAALDEGLAVAARQGVVRRGAFCWRAVADEATVRDRSDLSAGARLFERVCDEEIEAAIALKVRTAYGLATDELAPVVARALGFGRTTLEMTARIEAIATAMGDRGLMVQREGCWLPGPQVR
ncbi:MAG: DUF3320 domain-containing protein [bacterium]|nr:DUF3320 domain-containing protein [bacterium]